MTTFRLLACAALLAGLALLPGLDTPMVMQAGRFTGVINPAQGTIQIFEMSGERLTLRATTNFLADLEFNRDAPAADKLEWSRLRPGTVNTMPTYAEFFDKLCPVIDKNRGRDATGPSFKERAWNTEEAFWSKPLPAYDGHLAAALTDDGGTGSLLLILPQYYTMMFYFIEGFNISYAGHRNYRVDLMIPQVLNSFPTPAELLEMLPADVQADHKEAMKKQMEGLIEQQGAEGANMLPIAPSEPWLVSIRKNNQNIYAVVDPPNNRVLTYAYRSNGQGGQIELKSVRNIEVDLVIPSSFRSDPPMTTLVKDCNKWLESMKFPPVNESFLRMYAARHSVDGDAAGARPTPDMQANEDGSGRVVIDFPKRRKILVYDPLGRGEYLELKSMRDYSLEAAIGLLKKEVLFRGLALQMVEGAETKSRDRKVERATVLKLLDTALTWSPYAYKAVEANRTLVKELKDVEGFQALIDKAAAEATKKEEEFQTMMKAAIAEEERRKELRQAGR